MVESIPFAIADIILLKLGSCAFQQITLFYGVKDEARKLHNTLSAVRAVLLDADEKQEKSHLVQNWLRNLNDVVYDADNVLDEFTSSTYVTDHPDSNGKMKNQVREFFSSSNQIAFRYKMGRKMKKIREQLDEIAAEMAMFNFRERSVDIIVGNKEREQTHSFVVPSSVIGREREKEEIVKLLMGTSDQGTISVISIMGMGGLGKTTLAKLLYNDERVIQNFDLRIWVCVYDEFDVKLLIEKILMSGSDGIYENLEMEAVINSIRGKLEMEQLQILLRKKLSSKKYLLVLDDVWNENRERWMQLSELLMAGAKGSVIIVTTRSQKVAAIMDSELRYMLEGLPEDKSWSLFRKLAFRDGPDVEHPNLVEIGKNIVKKCHGVPLAIRSLGSMMKSKSKESEWLAIQNHEIWELPREDNDILAILKLSYDHLPIYLKQCFGYCSLFPKGYEFERKSLVQLWMAQNYIHPSGKEKQLEDIGNEYFEELLVRSFFQEVKKDDNHGLISCRMHVLMHDLACSVAGRECCVAEVDGRNISERVHHLSFSYSLPRHWNPPTSLLRARKMRTFLVPLQYPTECEISHEVMSKCFRCLRVLDFHNQKIAKVPRDICELIHLRYIDLSRNSFTSLPSSFSKLQNLQTLKLERCYRLRELPRDIRKMTSLKHLEIIRCSGLTHMPQGLGQLTSLQTLPQFIVGSSSSFPTSGGLDELNGLNQLRGELCIKGLEEVGDSTVASKEAYLKEKQHLEALRLIWCRETDDGEDADLMSLEHLCPHKNLRELHICGYGSSKFASWMLNNMLVFLPNITTITIERSAKCQYLPPFEQLPLLKVLKLYALDALEYICSGSSSSSYFPSLKELVLYDLPLLSEWPRSFPVNYGSRVTETPGELKQQLAMCGIQCFPCLNMLTIVDCPKLISMPLAPSLEELVMDNISEMLLRSLMAVKGNPEKISCLPKLRFLRISSCEDLETLPQEDWQNLSSLEHLEISSCANLTSLTEVLHSRNLQVLVVTECEQLLQKYNRETGEEWHKISHISNCYVS